MEISSVRHRAMATHQDEVLSCRESEQQQNQQQEQKKARPQPEQALKCPRCDSANTKFCYYNNYSLTQPRYFCKGCRRYWTKGGSLRNVPVGGGCRKNHKIRSSSNSKKSNEHDLDQVPNNPNCNHPLLPAALPLPPLSFDPADLTLAFANDSFMLSNPSTSTSACVSGFLDILRSGTNNNLSTYYGFGDQMEGGAGANAGGTGDAAAAGAGLMMFPNFDGGLVNSSTSASSACTESVTAATDQMDHHCSVNVGNGGDQNSNSNSEKQVVMGLGLHQWPVVDHANLGLESARDVQYWNGVAAAPWHGLINSSLM